MRPSAPKATDRRAAVADATLELLAAGGTRGLTHRLVDRHLGLPEGSTSALHRTRQSLLVAAVHRVVDLDLAQIDAGPTGPGEASPAAFITELISTARLPEHRSRHLARNVLMLEAANNPELDEALTVQRASSVATARGLLHDAGARDPELHATGLVAFIGGHIVGQVTAAKPLVDPAVLGLQVRAYLAAC